MISDEAELKDLIDLDPETATMLDKYWKVLLIEYSKNRFKNRRRKTSVCDGCGRVIFYSCLDQVR